DWPVRVMEEMFFTLATVAMASSMGRVTWLSTSKGPTLGYSATTTAKGKVKSGRRAMGKRARATTPSTIIVTAIIKVKTGRLTAKWEIDTAAHSSAVHTTGRPSLRKA